MVDFPQNVVLLYKENDFKLNSVDMADLKLTIKTFYGLEGVLKDELEEHGYDGVELLNRAVSLKANWSDVYYLNVHLRCAISVLVELKSFKLNTERDLYDQAVKFAW